MNVSPILIVICVPEQKVPDNSCCDIEKYYRDMLSIFGAKIRNISEIYKELCFFLSFSQ